MGDYHGRDCFFLLWLTAAIMVMLVLVKQEGVFKNLKVVPFSQDAEVSKR